MWHTHLIWVHNIHKHGPLSLSSWNPCPQEPYNMSPSWTRMSSLIPSSICLWQNCLSMSKTSDHHCLFIQSPVCRSHDCLSECITMCQDVVPFCRFLSTENRFKDGLLVTFPTFHLKLSVDSRKVSDGKCHGVQNNTVFVYYLFKQYCCV
jgi:hypothetical protein